MLGLGTYSILARIRGTEALTSGVAFAALSLFSLQEYPLLTVVSGFEDVQTLLTSFNRIQEFLLLLSAERKEPCVNATDMRMSSDSAVPDSTCSVTLRDLSHASREGKLGNNQAAFIFDDVTTGYPSGKPILKNVNLAIPRGKITMVVGPVGAGKTTLLKLILNETPVASGSVSSIFTGAAYSPQTPWITWGTIQHNIQGMSKWDRSWYDTVTHACQLTTDFALLPDGDQTRTGTRGSRLSGGQQARVVC